MSLHALTAFFDSRAHAELALDKLREAGILDANLSVSPEAADFGAAPEPESGFWAWVRGIFGAAPEYTTYREGLRRGGVMVVAQVDEARLQMACDILDEHGSVDLDARQRQWRSEGWSDSPTDASRRAQAFSSELDGGAAIAGSGPGRAAEPEMLALGEDFSLAQKKGRGRVHIHRSVFAGAAPPDAFSSGGRVGDGLAARLSENMEVLGADGRHVGVIDHIDGASIALRTDDPEARGRRHSIPIDWVESVDAAARLKLTASDAWSRWRAA
jgi:hypothetical protein